MTSLQGWVLLSQKLDEIQNMFQVQFENEELESSLANPILLLERMRNAQSRLQQLIPKIEEIDLSRIALYDSVQRIRTFDKIEPILPEATREIQDFRRSFTRVREEYESSFQSDLKSGE